MVYHSVPSYSNNSKGSFDSQSGPPKKKTWYLYDQFVWTQEIGGKPQKFEKYSQV